MITWSGAGRGGPTSVEIRSGRAALIVGEKATARADGCQRRRRRAGHLHTEDVGAAVGETTPEPRWLITADGGVVMGRRKWWWWWWGEERERERVRFTSSIPGRCCLYSWPASSILLVGLVDTNLPDMTPLIRTRSMEVVFVFFSFPDVFDESSEAVRFSSVRCGCSPSVSLWSGLERWITSYLPPRQHPPTADETTGLLVGVQEHILLQNTPLSPFLPAQGPC